MSEKEQRKKFSQNTLIRAGAGLLILGMIGVGVYWTEVKGTAGMIPKGRPLEYAMLSEDQIPQSIAKDVIPEYRELERALSCKADGNIYVVVTRGEKPTAGYDVTISRMNLQETKEGTNLIVTAAFTDPPEGEAVSQVITYPYVVAFTELTSLPDTIELRTVFQ